MTNRARCGCPTFSSHDDGVCWGRCDLYRRQRVGSLWVRVLKIVAIGLGVWGALTLLSGDTRPDAHEHPRAAYERAVHGK